jgi:uncharacterized surface protein with fasciclin (FAS1) repeats
MRKALLLLAAAAVAIAVVVAPATAAPAKPAAGDIVETAVGAGQFKTLASLLTTAGLVKTLQGKGPFTVFAPTDAAFAKVPRATLNKLAKDKKLLRQVLTYHVVKGNVPAAQVVKLNGNTARTVNGSSVAVSLKSGKVFLNGSTRVTATNVKASNGVIHVIDKVLLPPADIVGTAVGAGQFKTLASLLTKAGLVKTLQGKGPFTVFAPTDAAFAKVPAATLESLGNDPALLQQVLLYHVVKGAVPASTVVKLNGKSANTVSGSPVTISVKNGKVFLNGSTQVTATNVVASNGIIHVIDTVLLPPTTP